MDKTEIARRLLDAAYLEGDFVLRSGRRSTYYLDKYLFETDPGVLRMIIGGLAELVRRHGGPDLYDRLAAPELGAVSLGACLSLELDVPFVIVRKDAKEYGTGRGIEGGWREGDRVALIEDVVTSGGAALAAIDRLRDAGMRVEDAYCVVDREEGGIDAMTAAGITFRPLFTASELGMKES